MLILCMQVWYTIQHYNGNARQNHDEKENIKRLSGGSMMFEKSIMQFSLPMFFYFFFCFDSDEVKEYSPESQWSLSGKPFCCHSIQLIGSGATLFTSIVIQSSTGQTNSQRLHPTHSSFFIVYVL